MSDHRFLVHVAGDDAAVFDEMLRIERARDAADGRAAPSKAEVLKRCMRRVAKSREETLEYLRRAQQETKGGE